jgi:hypothetical protein
MAVTTDTLFTPLLETAVGCLAVALLTHPFPPTIPTCLRWGDHTSFGVSTTEDECCSGMSWVRFVDAVPTDEAAFPGSTEVIARCAQQWSVQLELGIARCAPTGTAHKLPTCGTWDQLKAAASADMLALRQAICCIQDTPDPTNENPEGPYRDLLVGTFSPHGPQGRCFDTTVDIHVRIIGCDEC